MALLWSEASTTSYCAREDCIDSCTKRSPELRRSKRKFRSDCRTNLLICASCVLSPIGLSFDTLHMKNDKLHPIEGARQTLQQALRDRDRADLSWINPPPEANGWTLTGDAIAFLDQLVRLTKPSHIIEFGAGLSTRAAVRA